MVDLMQDPTTMSPHGHTEPIESYAGGLPLSPGLRITVGPDDGSDPEEWEILRVDVEDGVFHLFKPGFRDV